MYAYHETRLGHSEHNYSVNAFSNYKLASYMDVYFCCTSMMIGHHKLPTSLLRQSYVVTPLLSIVGLWVFLSGTAKTLFFGSTPFLGEKCSRPSPQTFSSLTSSYATCIHTCRHRMMAVRKTMKHGLCLPTLLEYE